MGTCKRISILRLSRFASLRSGNADRRSYAFSYSTIMTVLGINGVHTLPQYIDMARSVYKVILIGNLTRDPELRTTPSGTQVCTFTLRTNRSWTRDAGEKKEESDFHRIIAWNK